jgi:hypothetical protein
VADQFSKREQALRQLPLPYSLALRLRDAGVARDVICEYVDLEEASLDGFYRVAEAKLECLTTRAFVQGDSDDLIVSTGLGTSSGAECNSGYDDDDA